MEWADFLGIPPMTLFTAIGVTMERGQPLRRVFEIFNLAVIRASRVKCVPHKAGPTTLHSG